MTEEINIINPELDALLGRVKEFGSRAVTYGQDPYQGFDVILECDDPAWENLHTCGLTFQQVNYT